MWNNRVTTEYIVNEEKRTVVCILYVADDIPVRLAKYNNVYLYDIESKEFVTGGEMEVRVYKGVAKCAPGDKWNETYGKRLAEYRANRARQGDVNNELRKYIKKMRLNLDNLEKYGMIKSPPLPKMPDPLEGNKHLIWDD